MKKIIITSIAAFLLVSAMGFSNAYASGSCTVTSFSASPTTIASGSTATVNWSTSGCDTVSITPSANPDNRPPSGSVGTSALTQTTTFTVVGHTDAGSVSAPQSVTITVTNGNGGGGTTTTTSGICAPTDFTATETTVASGDGTDLHWDSQNCYSASIVPAAYPGDRPPYGSVSTGAIFQSTEFTLTVYDAAGNIGGQRFLTINVASSNSNTSNDCTIDSFDANDSSIDRGDSTDLTWRTTGCDHVTLTSFSGELNADGSESVHPNSTTTYTLRAYDSNGNLGDTDTTTVSVNDNNNQTCDVDSFSASPSTIDRGSDSTLRWNTSGDVNYVTISGLSGNRDSDGSVSVSPYSTTTYTLHVSCNNGNDQTDSTTVYVNNNTQNSSAPQAITTVATVLNGVQARLNGIAVPNTNDSNTSAWFEWGINGSFGNRTNAQGITSGNSSQYYSDLISGLVPGASYSYRAVVQNQNGTAYGDTVRFQTTNTTPPPQVIVHSTTSTAHDVVVAQSAPSLLKLSVESNYDTMCVNGEIDYTITYQNISNQVLQKAVLQFNHPKEITYLTSSGGNYDADERTMTIDLGDVQPGEQGVLTVHARVNDTAISGNLTVATATVVYTNSKTHAQEDAIAYSLITVSNDCPTLLGASVFGFGSFLPSTLLGWLLLILVILALIVLGRQLYKKTDQPK